MVPPLSFILHSLSFTDEGVTVVRVPALGEAAARLSWLSPCAASLTALAHPPSSATWNQLRSDPGAVLLILRQAAATLSLSGWSCFPTLLNDPAIAAGALRHLEASPPCYVNWGQPAVQPVWRTALAIARRSHQLAERSGRCDPENAWVAGLLTPLGWLAVCAVDAAAVAACLADPSLGEQPVATQRRHWGLDQASIARRLARSWHLPAWLAHVIQHLGLPPEVARQLGADGDLLRIVQLAVATTQRTGRALCLAVGGSAVDNALALGLPATETEPIAEEEFPRLNGEAPATQPLLRDLLALAAENRRLRGQQTMRQLETELDDLQHALELQCAGEAERLQTRKLAALAEFAAGAGHEINNPLAVISGQAQYLLARLRNQGLATRGAESGLIAREHEPANGAEHGNGTAPAPEPAPLPADYERSLRTIIDQTRRVHGILRDLWQFAKPPQPRKETVDLAGLVAEVGEDLSELASQRKVQLRLDRPANGSAGPHGLQVQADPGQLRTALTCLLRNAIEAAPTDGWAEVRLETPGPDQVEVLVEDSGTPPALPQSEHLFDPFYSGRQAGRGRGLGLPTAWRFARAHGGDVRFVGRPGRPTRFVLSLPRENGNNGAG